MPSVLGLDPSLSSFGAAVITGGGPAVLHVWKSKLQAEARLQSLLDALEPVARKCDLAVIEGVMVSPVAAQDHLKLAGLHWVVRLRLHQLGIPCAVVQPSLRQMYLTGKGNANKTDCLLAAERRWPDMSFTGTDDADAYTLAHMGADWAGFAPAQMPASQRAVLARIVPAKKKGTRVVPAHPAIEWPASVKEKVSA